jgi:hypothetical protein
MARKPTLHEAIAAAGETKPSHEPRKVKPASKRGRPTFDTSASSGRVWSPTDLAAEICFSRDAIYKWESQGLERAIGGKGFTMAAVIAFITGRERAAGRMEADPDDVLEAEKLRDLRARADMREDERDLQRKKLIEAELAIAIYHDDCAHVSSQPRHMVAHNPPPDHVQHRRGRQAVRCRQRLRPGIAADQAQGAPAGTRGRGPVGRMDRGADRRIRRWCYD